MTNTKLTNVKDKLIESFRRIALYAAFILFGAAAMAFYIQEEPVKPDMKVYKAGEVSVSLNERGELTFLDRGKGIPVVVDSTLTEVINNMLAAREYVKVNTMRE